MIMGWIQQEDKTTINYVPNIGAPKYIKEILTDIKEESDNNTLIGGDINTQITSTNRSSRQIINKETVTLSDTLDWWI